MMQHRSIHTLPAVFLLLAAALLLPLAAGFSAEGEGPPPEGPPGQVIARSESGMRYTLECVLGKGTFQETPVTLRLRLRLEDLKLADQGWRRRGSVHLGGEVRDGAGGLAATIDQTFRVFRLPSDMDARGAAQETLELPLKLRPGAYSLLLRVEDSGAAAAGALGQNAEVKVPLNVPITAAANQPLTPADREGIAVRLLEPWRRDLAGPTELLADVRLVGEDRVAEVRFLVDGREVAVLTEPPYRAVHDFGPAGGQHLVQVLARSANGFRGTDQLNTTLDPGAAGAPVAAAAAGPPFTVALTSLLPNDLVSGPTLLLAEVQGVPAADLERVDFLVDGEQVDSVTAPPFQTTWNPGRDAGEHEVEAVAYDLQGHRAATRVKVQAMVTDILQQVERVQMSATIRDRMGKLVAEVQPADLRVLEDGQEQEILQVDREARPIRMALLLDDSGSMKEKIGQSRTAARRFVATLGPEDRALVVAFASEVRLLQDFTAEQAKLAGAIDQTRAEGSTAMHDALLFALEKFGRATESERRVIVLLSDGADTASTHTMEQVVEKAREREVMIYSIGFTGSEMARATTVGRPGSGMNPYNSALDQTQPSETILRALSDESGGRVFLVDNAGQLAGTYDEIATELRSQFVVVYRPSNPAADGTWREVEIRSQKKNDLAIRTRKGYKAR